MQSPFGMKDWFLAWSNISAEPFWHWLSDVNANPFWHWLSYVSAEPFGMEDRFLAWPSVSVEPFQHWLTDVSAGPFWQGCGLCYHMVRCECWALPFWYDYRIGSYMIRCKCRVGHSDLGSDISAGRRPTWRLGLQPTWKRVVSVELPVMRRIMR